MTRLGFLWARLMRQEAPLSALSVPEDALMQALAGRSVALVGNARGLAQTQFGPQIDSADLVIRINRAPMPDPASHGRRTDWLALAVRPDERLMERLHPSRVLWMSPKRKRLPWNIASTEGFYLYPLQQANRLRAALNAPPTTGAMLIDMLERSGAARIDLYGFDFFATLSLSGRRTADQVPHDFTSEGDWVRGICARDTRFRLN
ncbi:glycosyltransferase family 29 protein [Falsirhodobacter sp. alg1]|uniref:glycosyltransferase family 29 protein n=1 Tax=Falsirhodobacter sp. alg1 TaxID=1472418 RepID=UPI0005ED6B82|nr:glycosyltransferase family 29 protein [Falsirhodobacter sp. alg1]